MTDIQHWLLRVGDGEHYRASSVKNIWGIYSTTPFGKFFLRKAKKGDKLWFVKSGGQLIGVSTFSSTKARELGPLISFTLTNEELGWVKQKGEWDMEVHYENLYDITCLEYMSEIKCAATIRLYNEKCKVNLPQEYILIERYSKIRKGGETEESTH